MSDRPNILMIMCDQLRYDSLGFSGENAVCGHVDTPNLDALAADSLWFENAYSAIPTCCPARQCMLAGKRAESFGALWNYDITSKIASLRPEQPNWVAAIRSAGYRTAHIGKWHVSPVHPATDYGYDEAVTYEDYGVWRKEHYPDCTAPGGWFGGTDPIPLEAACTHYLADRACEAIRRYAAGDEPWHVFLDYSEPHLPCQPCAEFAEKYRPADMKPWPSFAEQFSGKPYIQKQNVVTWGNDKLTWEDWQPYAARYFAVISQVDDAVGRVLRTLRESGAADNTIILFTADHGDMGGSHRMIDKHYVLYDDTVHVPLMLHAPGVPPRRIRRFVNNCLDMAPTWVEAAGAEPFETDGISWMPLLRGESEDYLRDYAVSTLNGQQFGLFTQRMIRTDKWKYIWNLTATDELYDMENDPWEMNNLAHDPTLADTLAALRKKLYGVLQKEDPDLVSPFWMETQLLKNKKL